MRRHRCNQELRTLTKVKVVLYSTSARRKTCSSLVNICCPMLLRGRSSSSNCSSCNMRSGIKNSSSNKNFCSNLKNIGTSRSSNNNHIKQSSNSLMCRRHFR
mmetsp:Transcript_31879/g.67784  ORF Transcript_31879/g.67784 Transcript_31879/m.67784 type:complete len:102 (-) Transcript_31879:222-527(-)